MGFEAGITSFFERRRDVFENAHLEGSFKERMRALKAQMKAEADNKPTVVILGAGPAGLMRTIESISNGNPTTLIEKRAENTVGRINTVVLRATTVTMLRYCGIYQYLIENRLIYPPNNHGEIQVRLTDLECAMKKILREICPTFSIQYNSQVAKVDSQSEKLKVKIVNRATDEKSLIKKIDILVNCEGKSSSTNSLLGIERTEVLPFIPVVAAVYRDKRPKIVGLASLLSYLGHSVVYTAQTIHFHVLFLFKFSFSQKFRSQIFGSLILKTPGQNYVGSGFSDEINRRLEFFKKNGKTEEYKNFANRWIHFSICHANMLAIRMRIFQGLSLCTGGHLSLQKFEVVKIGADRAQEYSKSIHQTKVLITGDASATVDPVTGLGCNTALQSSVDFLDFIWDWDAGRDPDQLVEEYAANTAERVKYIHEESIETRRLYTAPETTVTNGE